MQLSLPLVWLSEPDVLRELRVRGVVEVERVGFRNNRSRLISLSADRKRLNLHECFQASPPDVLDAIAAFARAKRVSPSYRRAIARMRVWHEGQVGGGETDAERVPPPCCGTPEEQGHIRWLFREMNRARFQGVLPELLPVRLSNRMVRRLGHVQYGRSTKQRSVTEIALNADLLLAGNEHALLDTLLHEMAHAEAWLVHGHHGHGRVWRSIARRVGCEAAACSEMKLRRTTGRTAGKAGSREAGKPGNGGG